MSRINPLRPSPERLRELVASGLNDRQIGELIGVTGQTVSGWRLAFGIASNPAWTPERRARLVDQHRERRESGDVGERLARAADEQAWCAALSGRGYVDHPGAAGPQAFVTLRRPEAISQQSSMGWVA